MTVRFYDSSRKYIIMTAFKHILMQLFFQLLAAPEILDATPNSLDCDEWLI